MRSYPMVETALALLLSGLPVWAAGEEKEDPAARWVSVYGWNQTGDRLAAAGQWALAMGSYIESFQQIQTLAEEHPSYEPELIAYRRSRLEETISATGERLSSDEHETMMKYLDFIESLELGLQQRFSNQYEESLSTLDLTKSILDDLIRKKPPEFREAISSQYTRVEENIEWLSAQIDYKAASRRQTIASGDARDWGTTRFVGAEDLPLASDGGVVSGELFPVSLASMDAGRAPEEASDTDGSGTPVSEVTERNSADGRAAAGSAGAVRFRMNSQQKLDEAGAASR